MEPGVLCGCGLTACVANYQTVWGDCQRFFLCVGCACRSRPLGCAGRCRPINLQLFSMLANTQQCDCFCECAQMATPTLTMPDTVDLLGYAACHVMVGCQWWRLWRAPCSCPTGHFGMCRLQPLGSTAQLPAVPSVCLSTLCLVSAWVCVG